MLELKVFVVFAVEGLYHADAEQIFFYIGIEAVLYAENAHENRVDAGNNADERATC